MKLNRLDSAINRENRSKLNENMSIIESDFSKMNIDVKGYKETVEENSRLVNQANLNANDAFILANAIQDQLDSIVVEGDSSVEAAQARTNSDTGETYINLRARLDDENKTLTQQLSKINKKTPVLSLDEYEEYRVASAGGWDYAPAMTKMIEDLPSTGGAILVPNKTYGIFSNVEFNKTITLMGYGYFSILRGSGVISTDKDVNHKLTVTNLKLVNTSNNTFLKIDKQWIANAVSAFELDKVWFHSESNSGTLLEIYGARESAISNCWFTGTSQGARGIYFWGDSIGGVMNVTIVNCQFHSLSKAIEIEGQDGYFHFVAGIRIINCMFIGITHGLRAIHSDYIQIEQSMMDYVRYPVYTEGYLPNLKVRNSYFATNENNAHCINVNATKPGTEMKWFDISHNLIYSYAAVKGNGIVIHGNGTDIGYGIISNNQIREVNRCIVLITTGAGRVLNSKVNNNQAKNCNVMIALHSGSVANDIYDNYAEMDVATFLMDSGIANNYSNGNRHGIKRSKRRGKIIANGDGTQTVFSAPHNLILTPNWGNATIGSTALIDNGFLVTYDATNVNIRFSSPPPVGESNVVINWEVEI